MLLHLDLERRVRAVSMIAGLEAHQARRIKAEQA